METWESTLRARTRVLEVALPFTLNEATKGGPWLEKKNNHSDLPH